MPEGDIAWRVSRRLHAALAGRVLTLSDLRWPSLATVDLSGREVSEATSRGKHILVRVAAAGAEPPLTLHSHLRMEGSWHVHGTGRPWSRGRGESGVRAVLANDTWTAVGHKLGLLDQRNLAGIGTFFMAETLFLRGVTPWTPVRDVPDLPAVVTLAHRLLDLARVRGVQVTTGDTRPGRDHYVHARSGRPCLRCRTSVRVAPVGVAPQDRVAFYCPYCQRGPAPTDDGRPQRPMGAARS